VQYVGLGSTGVQVSRLCLGTGAFGVAPDEKEAIRLVHRALDLGVNFVDTANSYGNFARMDRPGSPPHQERLSSEQILGKALSGRRDDVVVATKVREPVGPGVDDSGLSRRHIFDQVERSLQALRTDHIDVLHMHGPDLQTPPEETMTAMDELVRTGKVEHVGFSNHTAWRMAMVVGLCQRMGLAVPAVHQISYNLARRQPENDVFPACAHFGLSVTAYSPLCMGLLAGRAVLDRAVFGAARFASDKSVRATFPEPELRAAAQLDDLADAWGMTPASLALAWLFTRPGLASAIIGPETVAELETAAPAADLALDPEQVRALDALLPPPANPEQRYTEVMDQMAADLRAGT
jgi:aryl-alcohol dehydrogenase-like predicted oxidoreductase